jgi:hypothetical protein
LGIVSITERFTGNQTNQESPDALHYSLSSTRVLDILVDDPQNWDSFKISSALSDPQIRSAYPDDFWLRCSGLQVTQISPIRYVATATYAIHSQLGLSPLSNPPIISYHTLLEEYESDIDTNGNAIECITHEDFDPPVRINTHDRVLRIVKNIPNYTESWADQFRNATNSVSFAGYEAGTVKCIQLDADSVADAAFQYWRVQSAFQIRGAQPGSTAAKAWHARRQAKGYYVNFGSDMAMGNADVRRATDGSGHEVVIPVCHDIITGRRLDPSAPPQFYEFPVFPSVDLNLIGLT